VEFFDCHCSYGPVSGKTLFPLSKPEALVAEMEHVGIKKALVYHATAVAGFPGEANNRLITEIKNYPQLVPAWVLLSPQTGEWNSDRFIGQMKEAGVRALWAFPDKHRYLLNKVSMGSVLEELVSRKIPLFLKADWELIYKILADFPDLVLVAAGHGPWGMDRFFRPLLEKYPNFYIDTANYELDWGLEDLCKKYGYSRILFGTATPERTMGGPLFTLLHAPISQEAKEAIASKNLERILGEARL
jgi:hypothetical protein